MLSNPLFLIRRMHARVYPFWYLISLAMAIPLYFQPCPQWTRHLIVSPPVDLLFLCKVAKFELVFGYHFRSIPKCIGVSGAAPCARYPAIIYEIICSLSAATWSLRRETSIILLCNKWCIINLQCLLHWVSNAYIPNVSGVLFIVKLATLYK